MIFALGERSETRNRVILGYLRRGIGGTALPTRVDHERRIRELQRIRAEYSVQLDEVRVKIARADERRKIDRGNERKWNRILDQLEASMDQLKSMVAACDGELVQLTKQFGSNVAKPDPKPSQQRKSVVSEPTEIKAKKLLKHAEAIDPGKLRGAIEKGYGGRVQDVSLAEATALLDEFEILAERTNLSNAEAKMLDAIRAILPVIAERMQSWQIRWSRKRK